MSGTLECDEFGRPILTPDSPVWLDICECRCDENEVTEFLDENGRLFKPNYHIVCGNKNPDAGTGDVIRCIDRGDRTNVKCEGKIKKHHKLNYLPYAELWI